MVPYQAFVALVFGALCTSAAPQDATMPSRSELGSRAPEVDDPNCSNWYTWYGYGGDTYNTVRFCFYQEDSGTVGSMINKDGQYRWGGIWYNAKQYVIQFDIVGSIEGGGNFHFSKDGVDGNSDSTVFQRFSSKLAPGKHHVVIEKFHLAGPYWGGGKTIDTQPEFDVYLN